MARCASATIPLLSYLSDKLMVGAIIGLDDTWQAEWLFPHSSGHYGQVMAINEMLETGDFETLMVPNRSFFPWALGSLARLRAPHSFQLPPPAYFERLSHGPPHNPFEDNYKTSIIRKVRSLHQPQPAAGEDGHAPPADLALRVSLLRGREEAVRWARLETGT